MNHLSPLTSLLETEKLDALLLTSPVARYYATGFSSSAGMVLVTRPRGYFFTDFRYIEAARAALPGFTIDMTHRGYTYRDAVGALLARHNVKKLGFEQDTMTVAEYENLAAAWKVDFKPAQKALQRLRAVKDAEELSRMEAAQRMAEQAFAATLPLIRVGMTERQVCAELISAMYRAGADNVSFDPIVVAGPNSSLPHGEPGDRPIARGDFLTIDFGVICRGYCSDTTRTVAVGEATEEMRRVYDTVLEAQLAGIRMAQAGVAGRDVHNAAHQVIADAGYGDYFGHGFGHGLGLQVHEPGGAGPGEEEPLRAGMVISAEPGIYLPGRFGVRIEDVIVIEEGGCRNLTALPKELLIL